MNWLLDAIVRAPEERGGAVPFGGHAFAGDSGPSARLRRAASRRAPPPRLSADRLGAEVRDPVADEGGFGVARGAPRQQAGRTGGEVGDAGLVSGRDRRVAPAPEAVAAVDGARDVAPLTEDREGSAGAQGVQRGVAVGPEDAVAVAARARASDGLEGPACHRGLPTADAAVAREGALLARRAAEPLVERDARDAPVVRGAEGVAIVAVEAAPARSTDRGWPGGSRGALPRDPIAREPRQGAAPRRGGARVARERGLGDAGAGGGLAAVAVHARVDDPIGAGATGRGPELAGGRSCAVDGAVEARRVAVGGGDAGVVGVTAGALPRTRGFRRAA